MTDEDRQFHRQDQQALANIRKAVWGLALVIFIPGVGSLVYMGQQIERIDQTEAEATANTIAIRTLEMSGAAIGERLRNIEAGTLRVERLLERIVEERRQ